MLHPSYTDLMKVANSEVNEGETPVVNSRYSIVMATAKRARELIDGAPALVNRRATLPLPEQFTVSIKAKPLWTSM